MKKRNFFAKLTAAPQQNQMSKPRKSHIPFRLNLLFFVIFALFVMLIVRLGYLQIVEGKQFEQKAQENSKITLKTSSPRGEIYDATGQVLAANEAKLAITYTRSKNVQAEELAAIAQKVNSLIDVPAEELTERDKKDYWLATPENLKIAQARLKDKDKTDEQGNTIVDETTLYLLTVAKVTEEEIAFDESTMKAATIFKRMNAAAALNTVYIKNEGVSETEIAIIGEHSSEIPGIGTGTDWTRTYPNDSALQSILGRISSEKTGLPEEEAEEFLAKGYAMNDRVGTSFLERQYEEVLQGTKAESEVTLDENGKIVAQTAVTPGEKGSNLKLTVDLNFQNKVEEILTEQYQQLIATGNATYSEGAYAVVLDAKTGAVLAMVGLNHNTETNELTSNAFSTIGDVFEPGSVVKGATLSAGYEAGVISGNDVLIDEPIQLAGSAMKASVFNRIAGNQIPLTAEQALEYSSNVYMMKLVFKMLNINYEYGMTLPYSAGDQKVFEILRNTYAEYGLGTLTGIDIPNESPGYVRTNFDDTVYGPTAANLLDLSFGQFDNYTPMQLAQYAATIANDGVRVAPHIVAGIYGNDENGNLGELQKATEVNELNKVNISAAQMKIIQQGFYDVVHGTSLTTTGTSMQSAKLDMAAKTGTAETTVNNTVNSNVIAYAPYDDPEIAISVVLPHLVSESSRPNQLIAKAIVDAYAEMYKTENADTNS